jgi:hypothetical protein
LDVPGFLALGPLSRLWLAGEKDAPSIVSECYAKLGRQKELTVFSGDASKKNLNASNWLIH